jgi:16S rRNA processing protein RimM
LRPHGIRGELRIRVLTDFPERIPELETIFIGTGPDDPKITGYTVTHARPHQGYMLLRVEGVEDRDQAERLRQLFVMVSVEDAVPLEEGEYYLYQLHGLAVRTDDGQTIGIISEVLETGANDVYIVHSPQYGEVLIPVTPEAVLEVNIAEGYVLVHMLDGLLPGA